MGESLQQSGGIISLARFIEEHRKAIQYDLITKTGYKLDDIGRNLSWDALDSFLSEIDADSALIREVDPDTAEWGTRVKTNKILADIWDQLSLINSNLVAIGSRKPAKTPKPYPRPGQKPPDDERKIGSGALPPDELKKWFEEKRKQYARNSTGDDHGHSCTGRSTGENNN